MCIITLTYGSDLVFTVDIPDVDLTGYTVDLFDAHPVFAAAAVTVTGEEKLVPIGEDATAERLVWSTQVRCPWSADWEAVTGKNQTSTPITFRLRWRTSSFSQTTPKLTVEVV